MKIIYGMLVVFLVTACASKNACELDKVAETAEDENVYVTAQIGADLASDQFTIDTAFIENDNLFLNIHFGGGCMPRVFNFYGAEIVTMSIPAKQQVTLVLEPAKDYCKKLSYKNIVVDLKGLRGAQEHGSKIFILDGWEKEIEYKY